MKSLTSEVVSKIVQFINERSAERSKVTHKRDENDNVVITITTELQPYYHSPKGNKVATNNGYKLTKATFDSITGKMLVFDSAINVGYGFEEVEFNGAYDLMPTYVNRVDAETVQAW